VRPTAPCSVTAAALGEPSFFFPLDSPSIPILLPSQYSPPDDFYRAGSATVSFSVPATTEGSVDIQ